MLAILSDPKQGLMALQFCNGSVTPFRMLIEQMPGFMSFNLEELGCYVFHNTLLMLTDVAEWVLNKCALSGIYTNTSLNGNPTRAVQEEGTDFGEDKPENNRGAVA